MFAIVTIAGQQFKVEEGQELFVNQLEANQGDSMSFEQDHLEDNDGTVLISKTVLASANVKATVLAHHKGDKVIVFKKKRRKGYKVKNGHRQRFTKLKIEAISA